ncbi:MAG: transketolase C-terminal domain-containing protein [Candidatus Eisenbacteria bacterium]
MPTMRDRFYAVTSELLASDPRTALVLADVGASRMRTTLERFPDRAINVGIREQAMVGVAAGLAMEGFRPILHSYAPFLVERAFEQLKLDLSYQGVGAILASVGASYDWPEGGRTHQAPGDIAILDSLPDWSLHVPGHPDEVEMLLRHEAKRILPAYLRLSTRQNERAHLIEPGRIVPLRSYSDADATIIAVGPMLDRTIEAVRDLHVDLFYATTVRPLDVDALAYIARNRRDVVLVEPYLEGTSSREVTQAVANVGHSGPGRTDPIQRMHADVTRSGTRVLGLGVPRAEHRHYGSGEEHDTAHGLDTSGIRRRIEGFLTGTSLSTT